MYESARQGGLLVNFRSLLQMNEEEFWRLRRDDKEFASVINKAIDLSNVYWLHLGQKLAAGNVKGDGRVWGLMMMNAFKFRIKQDTDHSSSDGTMSPNRELTDDELKEEIKRRGLPSNLLDE